MNILDSQYFRINKFASQACGVWPYQSDVKNIIMFTCFLSTILPFIIALLAGLLQEWSTDLIIILETLVILVLVLGGFINCIILHAKKNQTRMLYEKISLRWEKITDKNEFEILRKWTERNWKLTVYFLIFISVVFIVSLIVAFMPRLVNRNESRIDYGHFFPYYYHRLVLDDRVYHYQVLVHYSIAIVYSSLSYVAFSRTFIAGVRHVCGVYAIARYRLENVMKLNKDRPCDEVISNLVNITRQHKEAIKILQLIEKIYNRPLFVTEVIGFICIAIFIIDIKFHQNNAAQLIRLLFMESQFIIYLLFFNATGQQVLNSCDELFITAYFIKWYEIPVKARKLLLLIMLRAAKGNKLTAGTLIVLSMENYATILKASWSFATVLLTVFNKKRD